MALDSGMEDQDSSDNYIFAQAVRQGNGLPPPEKPLGITLPNGSTIEGLPLRPFSHVKPGMIMRNKGSGTAYTVLEVVNGIPVLIRSVTATNPSEWEVLP